MVLSLAFSPDGAQIVSGSEDSLVRTWDNKTSAGADDEVRISERMIWVRWFFFEFSLLVLWSEMRVVFRCSRVPDTCSA